MRFPDHLKGHRRFFKMDIWHLLDLFCFICWFGWIPFWVLNKEDWNIVPANPVVLCSFPLFLIFIMCLCASVCLFEVPCPQPCFHSSFKYSWKAKPLVWFLVFCAQITNIAMNPHSRTTCPDDSNTKRSAAHANSLAVSLFCYALIASGHTEGTNTLWLCRCLSF